MGTLFRDEKAEAKTEERQCPQFLEVVGLGL